MKKYNKIITKELNRILPYHLLAVVLHAIKYADENNTFNVGLDIDAENYKDILNIKRNNVIVTPHIAGVTKEAVERMDVEVANTLVKYISEIN